MPRFRVIPHSVQSVGQNCKLRGGKFSMKTTLKKVSALIFVAALCLLTLMGCGSKSSSELIIGRWFYDEDTSSGFQFFDDGTAVGFNGDSTEQAEWSISDKTLKLSNPYGDDVVLFEIEEINSNRLVLSLEDQEITLTKESD